MKKVEKIVGMGLAVLLFAPSIVNADNSAFTTSRTAVAGAAANVEAAATSDCGEVDADFNLIMSTTLSNTGDKKDLILAMSAETTLFTLTEVKSKGGTKATAWAMAGIEICIEAVDEAGTRVVADPGIITFDRRRQDLWAQFAGWDCTADLSTGIVTCDEDEVVGLSLDTTAAHHFNFIVENPGPKSIDVNAYARVTCSLSEDGSEEGVPGCDGDNVSAAIENASLVVFEVNSSNSK